MNPYLALVLLCAPWAPALAGEQPASPAPSPSAAPPRSATRSRPPTPPDDRRSVRGTLKALDGEEKTVTFQDETGKVLTWAVDERIAAAAVAMAERRMATLKPGDDVQIVYHLNAAGALRVIDILPDRKDTKGEGDR